MKTTKLSFISQQDCSDSYADWYYPFSAAYYRLMAYVGHQNTRFPAFLSGLSYNGGYLLNNLSFLSYQSSGLSKLR